jgi:hypothetical protein
MSSTTTRSYRGERDLSTAELDVSIGDRWLVTVLPAVTS